MCCSYYVKLRTETHRLQEILRNSNGTVFNAFATFVHSINAVRRGLQFATDLTREKRLCGASLSYVQIMLQKRLHRQCCYSLDVANLQLS